MYETVFAVSVNSRRVYAAENTQYTADAARKSLPVIPPESFFLYLPNTNSKIAVIARKIMPVYKAVSQPALALILPNIDG